MNAIGTQYFTSNKLGTGPIAVGGLDAHHGTAKSGRKKVDEPSSKRQIQPGRGDRADA